jgi:hypothetical protein
MKVLKIKYLYSLEKHLNNTIRYYCQTSMGIQNAITDKTKLLID